MFRYLSFLNCLFCIVAAGFAESSASTEGKASLSVSSWPPGAVVSIDSEVTGRRTPSLFDSLSPGVHEVVIRLKDYHFERRMVELISGTRSELSFRLIAVTEAQRVVGSDRIGALVLPTMPVDSCFRVDDDPAYPGTIVLEPGTHRVRWNGGLRFSPLDTQVAIEPGKSSRLNFAPCELSGRLSISTDPPDALILLDRNRVETPLDSIGIHAGSILITVMRTGFLELDTVVSLNPRETLNVSLSLRPSDDFDEDGFPDSIDLCPESFGIHDGCPTQPRRAGLRLALRTIRLATGSAPLSFSITSASAGTRTSTLRDLRELLSLCADGPPFFSGVRGISVLNEASICWRALRIGADWNQSIAGMTFNKAGIAFSPFGRDTFVIASDTLREIFPRVLIPSVGLGAGVRLSWKSVGVSWNIGYRFESIIVQNIGSKTDYDSLVNAGGSKGLWMASMAEIPSRKIDNNHWYQTVRAEMEIPVDATARPVVFGEVILPVSGSSFSNWTGVKIGMDVKFAKRR